MTSTQSKSSTKSSKPSGPRPSGSSTSRSSVSSSTPTPTRSALSKEGERLFGRAFSAKELTQFELVRELKPDWTTQKVLEFCKKYEFDETNISRELSAEFEFERASHEAISEEWQDVPKREPKKKETTPTAAPTGKFTPATDRPKTAGGKPDGKPFVNGGKKYQPSAASDRAYALMKQQQEKERLEKEKKKEVPLPVPGKSFLAALVKPPAPTPTPSPPPAQAQTAAKTNGSTTATPATGAPSTATPAAATIATATTTAAAPTTAPKSEEKKEESKSGKGSKTGDAKSPSSPSAAPTKTWQKKDKSAAQAAAAATTTPAATSTTTPATNAATTTTTTTTPATTATNATTQATTTPATSTPAAAASSTTSATPAATPSTTAVTPAAAPSTTEAAATPAPAATPAATAPVTPATTAAAPAAAAKPTPAAAPSTAVNPRVNDLLSSEQKVLLPSHIASAASGTFQFTSKASGPRAPKPKDAAPVAAPAAAAAAPAPVAAAPAAAQPTVQQTAPVQQLQAAIGGNSRPFGGLSSSTGPAPIGSKPIGSHLDSTPSGQPTGTDNEIIPGGHASAHHFGSTLHDDAHLGSSTGAEASAYDNSQFGNQLQNFHQDVLAGANQGVASNYDAEYQQSVNYSGATGQNDEFYGSYDYNQFGRKPQGQRPPQGQQRGQAQGQQNFQQRVNTGLPKSSQPMSQQQGGLGPNAGQRPGVNAVNNTNKPPQQQMQQQQQNRPVGAQATGFPSQQGQAPGQFNQQPKPQQQPQQQYQQYQQNFPNKPIGGQPNSPQFNQGNKNVAPGQQQQQQQGGYNKQFNNKPNQNNPQAYTAYSQYPAGYGYGQQYGMPGGYNSYYQPGYGYPYGQPAAPFAQPNRFPAYQQSFGGYPGQISPTFDNSGYGASDDHSKYMYANQPAAVQSNVGTDGQPLLAQAPQAGGYEGWGQDAISGSKAGVKQDAPSGDLNARGAAVGVPNYSAGFSASPALTGAPVQQGPYSFQQPQQSHIINHQPFPQPQDQQRYQQSFQQWSQQ